MKKEIYYDDFGNKATIEECLVYPYRSAKNKEKGYKLTLVATYDNDFIYHVSLLETFEKAFNEMMKTSCATWQKATLTSL